MMRNELGQFKNVSGKNHPRWKGKIRRGPYWYTKNWEHPNCGKQGYVAVHRLIMEKHLGRYLEKSEAVHHIDGDASNNAIENLKLFSSKGQHTKNAHPEIYENQRKEFKGKHFSPGTEFKKGNVPWNKE